MEQVKAKEVMDKIRNTHLPTGIRGARFNPYKAAKFLGGVAIVFGLLWETAFLYPKFVSSERCIGQPNKQKQVLYEKEMEHYKPKPEQIRQ